MISISQFNSVYPDDNACLHKIFAIGYNHVKECPKCNRTPNFSKVKNRRSYQCLSCGHQIYPTVGTIFERSSISLKSWFLIMYLHTTTRNGISAKEIERLIEVSYPTALRMAHRIKSIMMQDFGHKLSNYVMVDETYIGMKSRNMHSNKKPDFKNGTTNKITVMGFMEKSGTVITKVMGQETIPAMTYKQIVEDNVDSKAILITDAFPAYKNLHFSFPNHIRVDHTHGEYVKNGHSTNPLENYWSTLKRMIKGTHIHVSKKHLSKYIAENTFRYMNRHQPDKMFELIIDRIRKC